MLHDIGLVDWVNCRGKFLLVRGVASYSYVVPRTTTTLHNQQNYSQERRKHDHTVALKIDKVNWK